MRLVYPEMQPNAVRNLATPRVASKQTELGCAWERRACEQGGHGTDSPQTFQEPKGIRTTTVDLAEIARSSVSGDLSAKSSKQVNHAPEEGTNGPHNLCRATSLSAGKRAI